MCIAIFVRGIATFIRGRRGFVIIRVNRGGKLYSLGYGSPAALQIDPIEKKPLSHFLPGSKVFSMGTAGCNMGCFFCQNWDISKSRQDQVTFATRLAGRCAAAGAGTRLRIDRVHL